jgi:integrase
VLDGELPPILEKRPEGWRELAKFTREEIASLIGCAEVELQYRVMYAVYFLTGSRFAEVTTIRVRSLDLDVTPLAALTIRAVKQRRDKGVMYRVVPVHAQLRAWLTWWLREGFELVHCRKPTPDDYLFPTCSLRRKNRGETICSHGEVYKRWARHHLPAVQLRHRRLHDARRTFISIARSSRVDKSLVRAITHRATADTVLDAYTTFEWEATCQELSKVDFRLPGPPSAEAQVVSIAGYVRRARSGA